MYNITADEQLNFLLENKVDIKLAITLFNETDRYSARNIYYHLTEKWFSDYEWEELEDILRSHNMLNW